LERARALAAAGQDGDAIKAYVEALHLNPAHRAALNELGALAYAGGFRSAARTAYEQIIRYHPDDAIACVNLGNLFYEDEDFAAARAHFEAALAARAHFAEAHQGLARALTALGETEAAAPHWEAGFRGHALVSLPYRGTAPALPLLMLVSAKGGNIPARQILDERMFAAHALYTEYYDSGVTLPPHALVFNAIGDADLCGEALARADDVLARTTEPVINPPHAVRETTRLAVARRLADVPGVVVPDIRAWPREALTRADDLTFPLLLRAPGFHTGKHFVRVEDADQLAAAVAALPGTELLSISYLDARGADGLARKYRVMILDGALYPLHMAVSAEWKVHYFSAAMADNAAFRKEEQRFLENMEAVIGARAVAALGEIARRLGLDYAGVDFGLDKDGRVLLFEANATMVINPPEPDPIWDYRRAPIVRAIEATRRMLRTRAGG
jgi:tetratricopeptide (TPR) repeat protein